MKDLAALQALFQEEIDALQLDHPAVANMNAVKGEFRKICGLEGDGHGICILFRFDGN